MKVCGMKVCGMEVYGMKMCKMKVYGMTLSGMEVYGMEVGRVKMCRPNSSSHKQRGVRRMRQGNPHGLLKCCVISSLKPNKISPHNLKFQH